MLYLFVVCFSENSIRNLQALLDGILERLLEMQFRIDDLLLQHDMVQLKIRFD